MVLSSDIISLKKLVGILAIKTFVARSPNSDDVGLAFEVDVLLINNFFLFLPDNYWLENDGCKLGVDNKY